MLRAKVRSRILTYWRAIELFSSQAVPKAEPNHSKNPVFRVLSSEPLPWQPPHPLQNRTLDPEKAWRYTVYGGLFTTDNARKLLEEHFGEDRDVFERQQQAAHCLFAFDVTEAGRPIYDTFAVSSLGWALSRTLAPGPQSDKWLAGFEEFESNARLEFEHFFALRDIEHQDTSATPDNDGFATQEETPARPLHHGDLVDAARHWITSLGLDEYIEKPRARIRTMIVKRERDPSKDEPVLLNSFFAGDLAHVSHAIDEGRTGTGITDYLTSPSELDTTSRVDVRSSNDILFQALAPAAFPIARWPAPGHFPLVANQQFAINSMVSTLGEGRGITAINGPPGTGKTTLLRDLVAHVIVQRAKALATLASAADAFDGTHGWQAGERRRTLQHWRSEFHGHEMVVASSNNGAVQNITLEVPRIDAIDKAWLPETDYFAELASEVLGEQAWGLIAAKLGKQQNRSDFRKRFFFTRQATNENDHPTPGMLDFLEQAQDEIANWPDAVAQFESALAESIALAADRQHLFELSIETRKWRAHAAAAQRRCASASTALNDASIALQLATHDLTQAQHRSATALQRRLEHRRLRPGLIEIVFTLGRSFRDWRDKDVRLAALADDAEQKAQTCEVNQLAALNEQTHCQQALSASDKARSDIARTLCRLEAELNDRARLYDGYVPEPDSAAWHDDTQRELSAPWADRAWNDSRTRVFIAALALHKSFMQACSTQFRYNLLAVLDLLDGSVPHDAPAAAVEDAWRTLFFVVPVVSTTFSSFARLFPHLGAESIGWLLIDEAGQAKPQDAVGALWRSRRAVIVGDPLQLQPVVTIPLKAQEALRRHHNVDTQWIPGTTSVQGLADRMARLGTWVKTAQSSVWVGSPLRVHRRCDQPMVDICNTIAYNGLMVDGTARRPEKSWPLSTWLDVRGATSEGNWVPDEGKTVQHLLKQLKVLEVDLSNIFLISPFRIVTENLKQFDEQFPGVRIGTVHTTQGQEADIVVLVLGTNPANTGARDWAAATPNLLNVAVSRAKQRLYVVGNLATWSRCAYFGETAVLLQQHCTQAKTPGITTNESLEELDETDSIDTA